MLKLLPKKDARRHPRIPYLGRVRISWEGAEGVPKYTQGKCLDVSEGGMRIEVSEAIPAHSRVLVQADRINLGGSASVKHVARQGSKYVVALELHQALRDLTLNSIR